MPIVSKNMVGMDVIVKLELTEANVTDDSNIYEAIDLCDSSVANSTNAEYSAVPKSLSFNHSDVSMIIY